VDGAGSGDDRLHHHGAVFAAGGRSVGSAGAKSANVSGEYPGQGRGPEADRRRERYRCPAVRHDRRDQRADRAGAAGGGCSPCAADAGAGDRAKQCGSIVAESGVSADQPDCHRGSGGCCGDLHADGAGTPARPLHSAGWVKRSAPHDAGAGGSWRSGGELPAGAAAGQRHLRPADRVRAVADRGAERRAVGDADAGAALCALYRVGAGSGFPAVSGLRGVARLVGGAVDGGAVRDGGIHHIQRGRALALRLAHRGQPAGDHRGGDFLDLPVGAVGAGVVHPADRLPCGAWPSRPAVCAV